jgi:cytochrome c oxidase subunit II
MNPLLAFMGLPINASGQGHDVDHLIFGVHLLMFALFVGWLCYFIYVLVRYRQRRQPKADYKGFTGHISTYIEGVVALIEAALLIGLAIPVWARTVEKFPDAKDSTVIHIIGKQFQWTAWYPGTNGVFVKADPKNVTGDNPFGFDKNDPNFKNNFVVLSDFVIPVGKPVIAHITSQDVIHSFSCRPLRTMQDAIPGMEIPAHFTPAQTGTYLINCAQLCGSGHYAMRGSIKVVTAAEYEKWLAGKTKGGAAAGAGYE